MELSALAFALLIGAQFLAAVVLISKRKAIYGEPKDGGPAEGSPSAEIQGTATEQEMPAKAA